MPPLFIGAWNLQGLISNDLNKTDENKFIQFTESNDIVIITETHLEKNESIGLNSFKIVQTCREKHKSAPKNSGGVLIAFRRKMQKGITICDKSNTEFIWLKLDKDFFNLEKDIYLAGVYIPPNKLPIQTKEKT